MALKECERCKTIFSDDRPGYVCGNCLLLENKELREITDYLRKFPMASVMEVVEETEVPVASVMRFIKQGALRMTKAPDDLKCRLCGIDVSKGTLCQKCREKIERMNEVNKRDLR